MIDPGRLRAYLKLHLAEGVGAVTFKRLVETFGDVEAAAKARGQWQRVEGVGPKTAEALEGVTDAQIDDELAAAAKAGAEIVVLEDRRYPTALAAIHDPPPVLYVRGRMEPTDALAISVVGSRHCTHYGLEQAERFGQLLGRAGFTVVSGGARGIDTAAHRGALGAGGRTITVMGCGLCQTYPRENDKLFEQIVSEDRGAIISELPMRTAVLGGNFPTRNRIISGLSLGVLIVEAARRSGSLHTAREAAEQGREVFALPGRVDSPLSQGANELIRNGAILVQDLDDILEHLGQVGAKMGVEEAADQEPLPRGLNETESSLLAALREGPASLDELVRSTGIDSGKAASAMTMLVLRGLVIQQPGSIFAAKGKPRSAKRQTDDRQ
jgi:DNA processing protein